MKISLGTDTYWHASNSELELGKIYTAKKAKPYFGDYEKILEIYRPKGTYSRMKSFYLCKNRDFVEDFGSNTYKVECIGPYTRCALGWVGILQTLCETNEMIIGFRPGYGSILKTLPPKAVPAVKEIVKRYFGGIPPKAKDFKLYEANQDSEARIIEILAPKIRVIKVDA